MSTSVVRALRILELLASNEKPMSLARVAERLSIPKSTAHGIVASMVAEHFLRTTAAGEYTIGIRAFEVGSAFVRKSTITDVVGLELVGVTRTLEVTSHYAVLDGNDAVYLVKEDPPRAGVQLASSLGARLPSHVTAVGKACLAWLTPEQIREHCAAGVDQNALTAELSVVRRRGYSTDDGATAVGIRCVAAPVFDAHGPLGSIGVSYLRDAGDDRRQAQVVMDAAARASDLLGGGNSQ